MSITLTFDDKGYLPGLAHQLVSNLRNNPDAALVAVEDEQTGVQRELVFGLDGKKSEVERLLITDIEVLVAARQYCRENAPEFTGKMLEHTRAVAYMIDEKAVPQVTASSEAGAPSSDA